MIGHEEGLLCLPIRPLANTGMKQNANSVLAGAQAAGDIWTPAPEAIVSFQHNLAIDFDSRDRIEISDVEIPVAPGILENEVLLDLPVLFRNPSKVEFIAPEIGIRNEPRIFQGRMHITRNGHQRLRCIVQRRKPPVS